MHNLFQKAVLITTTIATCSFAVNRPYPQRMDFAGCIKPDNVTQAEMDNSITALYDSYKAKYLKSNYSGHYIKATGNGPNGDQSLTISEAHGYGMIITVLMAGHDSDAQTTFDGMYKFFQNCPSENSSHLMSWLGDLQSTAATDGDMDIAYALILADKQWGSHGAVNYLEAAKSLINNGIKSLEMSTTSGRTMLGDWDDNPETTRSSDWMAGHMRAYGSVTGDDFWFDAADTVYSLVSYLTTTYAPQTGLLPCFVSGWTPYPDVGAGTTGEANGEKYSYNACRAPWRFALDYAHNGTPEAKSATSKMLGWLRGKTNGDVGEIKAGYTLDGEPFLQPNSSAFYSDLVFNAPFAAGAITDPDNQEFLNSLWEIMKDDDNGNKAHSEYGHALNILSMLLISGNWWAPTEVIYREPTEVFLSKTNIGENQSAGTFVGKLQTDGNGFPMTYAMVEGSGDFRISNDSLFSVRVFEAAVSNSLSLKVKVEDNQNASATTPLAVSVSKSGENIVHAVDWVVAHDPYWQTTVDTVAGLVNDNVAITFNIGRSQGQNYVYGTLKTSEFDSPLNSYDSVTVKYKSSGNYRLTLPMSTVNDDAYHAAPLPSTNNSWSEVTLPINSATFNQPTNWGVPVGFDPSRVSSLSFDAGFEGESGRLEIESISFKTDNPASIFGGGQMISRKQFNMAMSGNQMNLTVPTAGVYNISIYSLNGQLIREFTQNINSGFSSVSLDGLSNQMFLVQLSGAGHEAVFKGLVK